MKKIMSMLLVAVFLLTGTLCVSANTVIGTAYNTDIVAYINHYAIPSYAVNGTSVIVVEDLRNFGFNVNWDGAARTLSITRNTNTNVNEMSFTKDAVSGSKFSDIYSTDIGVYAGYHKFTSYALNGYTMIPIEELAIYGQFNWVEGERAAKLWIDGLHVRQSKQNIVKQSNSITNPNAHNTSNPSNIYGTYYPGTAVPNYSHVTGIPLKEILYLDDGSPVYVYSYTSANDVGKYWNNLTRSGFSSISSDDESTTDTFESAYSNLRGSYVILWVILDSNEVWITTD